ncbi:hypothetical protein WH7805_06721 [Synechococcus sp. WH 7805]|nr:hypothetical protein WH7805_06721 [Synechococcus sp. WH 7805]
METLVLALLKAVPSLDDEPLRDV